MRPFALHFLRRFLNYIKNTIFISRVLRTEYISFYDTLIILLSILQKKLFIGILNYWSVGNNLNYWTIGNNLIIFPGPCKNSIHLPVCLAEG